MAHEKIWLSSPHMGGAEQTFVHEAFETNWIAPLGPHVNGFEEDLAKYLQEDVQVAALSSGTAALHLALLQCGVRAGDTVLCQSMTFSATANPIVYLGAKPFFVDSERDTWNLCPDLLEFAILQCLEKGIQPKAIIAVHLYGMPAKIDEITALAQRYNIPLIEDAAEALGSSYKHRACGTFGRFGILSFNGNKIITTSGGGALVCHTAADKTQSIFLSTQAREQAPHYEHKEIGYNYRLSNVCAGIGRGQMQVLEERVQQRRAHYAFYKNALSEHPLLTFVDEPIGHFSNRWLTTLLTDSFETREKIRKALEQENIESRPLWKPMHLQPVFRHCESVVNGVSEDLFNRGLCLPSGSNLRLEDLQRVVEGVGFR